MGVNVKDCSLSDGAGEALLKAHRLCAKLHKVFFFVADNSVLILNGVQPERPLRIGKRNPGRVGMSLYAVALPADAQNVRKDVRFIEKEGISTSLLPRCVNARVLAATVSAFSAQSCSSPNRPHLRGQYPYCATHESGNSSCSTEEFGIFRHLIPHDVPIG